MRKQFWIVGFCLFVLLAAAALSIMVGSFAISPSDVLRTLLGGGSSTHAFAVFQIRLPRIVLAILVGSALGVSGAILQGITKNPLAEPGMIGINAGSALFVVLWISYGANAYYSSLSNVKVLFMPLLAILHCGLSICVFMAQGNPPDSLFTHRCRCQCRNYRSDQLLSAANEQRRL